MVLLQLPDCVAIPSHLTSPLPSFPTPPFFLPPFPPSFPLPPSPSLPPSLSLLPSPSLPTSLSLPPSFPLPPYLPPSTPQFQVSRDYSTSGDHPLSLKKGDVVEVLDNKIEERWFVRTQSASPEAGWVPPTVLMPIGRDEADGRSSKTIITSGAPVLLFVPVPFWSTNHSP